MALQRLGRLAFGPEWKTPLSVLVGRRWRQVHRWAEGQQGIPADVWTSIRDFIAADLRALPARKTSLEQAIDECKRRGRT